MSRAIDDAKRREWQARFERFRASDLTVGRFCSAERVSVNSFYYWAKRLESRSASPALQTGSRRWHATPMAEGTRQRAADRESPCGATTGAAVDPAASFVRFLLGDGVEIVVPAERLDVVGRLVRCLRRRATTSADARSAGPPSAAFHEVVVAAQ